MTCPPETREDRPDASPTGYRAGDSIMVNSPWVWALDPENRGSCCEHCFSQFDLGSIPPPVKCRACQHVQYCSLSCLVSSYKQLHRLECGFFKRATPETLQRMSRRNRCIILALLLAEEEGDNNKEILCEPKIPGRTWKRLLSHWSEFRKRPDVLLGVRQLREFIRDFVGEDVFGEKEDGIFNFDSIGEAFGKFAINSFTISDDNFFNELGCGVYLSGSVFDHSCWPNASRNFVGKNLHAYATRPIPSFEEVTISYNFLYQQPDARRAELKIQYFFDCMCEICVSPERKSQQKCLLEGCPLRSSDEQTSHAIQAAKRKANEALMILAGVMNISMPDRKNLRVIVKTSANHIVDACGSLSVTNAEVNEYLDRCGFLMDSILNQPQIAAIMYELTVLGYKKIFPEGCFELLLQMERWLDCAIKSEKGLKKVEDWKETSRRAVVAYVTSVRPYVNHAPKLRCDGQISWNTLLGLCEETLQNGPTFSCWVEDETKLVDHLKQLIKNL